MPTPVVMPQMGESIAEGTIVRWIKKVGDTVDRDEPLFEISTDKVDAEIPSPAAGVLTEITVKEGETVAGQQRRRDDRRLVEQPSRPPGAAARPARPAAAAASRRHAAEADRRAPAAAPRAGSRQRDGRTPASRRAAPAAGAAKSCAGRSRRRWSGASRRSTTSTSRQIHGTRPQRTRHEAGHPRLHRVGPAPLAGCAPGVGEPRSAGTAGARVRPRPGERVEIVPMTVMRKKIAEHMVLSAHTSPHVYSVYEVNFRASTRCATRRRRRTSAAAPS